MDGKDEEGEADAVVRDAKAVWKESRPIDGERMDLMKN